MMREKDQADFDLERFVELFDECMTSTNPAVQKAFKNLLFVASIAHSDTKNLPATKGPLRRLVDDIGNLNRRIERVENRIISAEATQVVTQSSTIDYEKITAMSQAISPMYASPQHLDEFKKGNKND
jgi:hypothetical protein